MLERIRLYRWVIVMGLVVLSSCSWLVWFWRQGFSTPAARATAPDSSELEALRTLQEENNALAAQLQQLQATGATQSTSTSSQVAATGVVNINTATEAELDTLPGIGPSKAAAIVAYRTEHGRFRTTYDITNVKGIGESTYQELKPLIAVE